MFTLEKVVSEQRVIDLESVYDDVAKVKDLDNYITCILKSAGEGEEVVLTGRAPIWLYLKAAHALHGKAKKLYYDSPVTGQLLIFDHSPD